MTRRFASGRGGPGEDARRDLDQALALLGLFRAAFATSAVAPDFSSTQRTIGLIARDREPARE